MARQTHYIIQPFTAGPHMTLKALPAIPAKNADVAERMARKIAASKLGVVAYSSSGDPDTGDYDEEPTIIFRAGRVPPQFAG